MSGPESHHGVPVKPGDLLAEKYEVERVLGVGGMGVVVAAHHVHLKQRVALKFLLPDLATNGEVVARFVREAQSASTIRSEHVVRVTDVGILASGAPYMVMEYLEGRDLGQLLVQLGRLSVPLAVDYILQAMEALAEAHHAGIVHRDLKPSNLFLTERADGSPLIKVLDFGISKITRAGGDTTSKSLTRTAGLMGSPLYMSPEQIRSSKNVDARADVWSLGVIVYELLVGKSPFWGEEMNGVLAAIVADDPVPLKQARSDVPRELEAVVMKCLAKKPEARYPGVGALAKELLPFGSRSAQISVERVLGVSSRRGAGAAGGPASEVVTLAQPAGTAGAWTQRASGGSSFGPKRLTLVAVALVAVAGIAGTALVLRSHDSTAPSAAPAEPTPPSAAAPGPPATSTIAPEALAAPPVAPVPTPSPVASAAETASPPAATTAVRRPPQRKPPAPPPAAPKPSAKTPKKGVPSVGDMIDERR